MKATTEDIKVLREQTGAGIMECKRALEGADGDFSRAVELLREKGFAKAAKKAARETREGLVHSYIHSGGRIGSLVEVNCETDYVARTDEFRELAHNLAMQVAAMSPTYVSHEDVPPQEERPPEEVCLLYQPFIRDPGRQVRDLIQEMVAKVGENVRVRRFVRFALGE